uniref:Succinate dehydrogenase subunit 7, mitochondrial n=1 Tax=Oryza punctata TaxID=4537 RepID=A0A0E0M0R3_ORYPU
MAQPAFLSSLRSRLRSPQAQAPALPHLQAPRRGFHVELGAREKALLEEDTALKRFKSYKNSVKQVSRVGNILTGVVLFACAYEIVTLANS